MDKKMVLDAMEHIDLKLIEEADTYVKVRHAGVRKYFLIAACVSALILTTAFAASVIFAVPDVNKVDRSEDDGVGIVGVGIEPSLDTKIEDAKVSSDLFSDSFLEDVSAVPEGERLYYYFDDWSEMEEYIGYNILDNTVLDEARPSVGRYGHGDVTVDTHGYLYCYRDGRKLSTVNVSASYETNPVEITTQFGTHTYWVNVHIDASVDTELSEREHGFSSYNFPEGSEITEETYVSSNGRTFTIIRVLIANSKSPTFYSFFYLDHAYITIRTSFGMDESVALSTMKEVLDGFVIA